MSSAVDVYFPPYTHDIAYLILMMQCFTVLRHLVWCVVTDCTVSGVR